MFCCLRVNIKDKSDIPKSDIPYPVRASALISHKRKRIGVSNRPIFITSHHFYLNTMANKFKAGDAVKLKTGSPTMTIKGNATKSSGQGTILIPDKYECRWTDGQKVQTAVFREDILELA
jgi:uncharacterized protein YodC (DUF2158 family)